MGCPNLPVVSVFILALLFVLLPPVQILDESIDKWTLDVFELGKAAGGRPIVPLAYFIFKVRMVESTSQHISSPSHGTPPHCTLALFSYVCAAT